MTKPAEFQCACERCQAMCAQSTCLPTPAEARQLIRAGLAGRLATYRFPTPVGLHESVGPAPAGMEGQRELPDTRRGACTFFSNGKCELHAVRLKPLEGRMAHHTLHWLPIRQHVAGHWKGKQFQSVLVALDRELTVKAR